MAEAMRDGGAGHGAARRLGTPDAEPRLPVVDRLPGTRPATAPLLAARRLGVRAGQRSILRAVDVDVVPGEILAIVGPSGVGKSTLLKCLNRLIDLEPELAVEGDVLFEGRSIYGRGIDPDLLRARIGAIFQQPVVFPATIYENAVFGLRHLGLVPRRRWAERIEAVLHEAALWDEVRDRLARPAAELSVGQQQRLCLARALAVEPAVLLMDEPTSALDPKATRAIEERILALRGRTTVVLVTHDLRQAERVADRVACLCPRDGAGEVLDCAIPGELFANPACREVLGR